MTSRKRGTRKPVMGNLHPGDDDGVALDSDERRSHLALVCIHGLAGSSAWWDSVSSKLRETGPVYPLDLPRGGATHRSRGLGGRAASPFRRRRPRRSRRPLVGRPCRAAGGCRASPACPPTHPDCAAGNHAAALHDHIRMAVDRVPGPSAPRISVETRSRRLTRRTGKHPPGRATRRCRRRQVGGWKSGRSDPPCLGRGRPTGAEHYGRPVAGGTGKRSDSRHSHGEPRSDGRGSRRASGGDQRVPRRTIGRAVLPREGGRNALHARLLGRRRTGRPAPAAHNVSPTRVL